MMRLAEVPAVTGRTGREGRAGGQVPSKRFARASSFSAIRAAGVPAAVCQYGCPAMRRDSPFLPVTASRGPVVIIRTRGVELVLHRLPAKSVGVLIAVGSAITSVTSYRVTR
ncbi:hypothetical protein ACFWD7_55355 [Streptomyces mirabilis]|uniref:hypothetical protein n=1 Tax=Streptomyces mirabilis TaxID=68239 RepID=UPI0021BE03BB|nr:hypothetical protein [Streptomyces mirabilis]MCT9114191.1 hypothetical protein [Streptomyces mirabilis]